MNTSLYRAYKEYIKKVELAFLENKRIFAINNGDLSMRVPARKVEDNMEFISQEEMTQIIKDATIWWTQEFSKWRVSRKEFYIALHEMSEVVFKIYKTTGWRGAIGITKCSKSKNNGC